MANMRIPIENAVLMVTNIESLDGSVGFDIDVSAHILRNVGGSRVSVYIHDKRELYSRS